MKISPTVLNRLEELDIVMLNHNGDPIAFSKNFSIYIDSYMTEREQTRKFGDIIKQLLKKYASTKLTKYDNIRLYVQIISEMLTYISMNFNGESCEEFRIQTLKRLHL